MQRIAQTMILLGTVCSTLLAAPLVAGPADDQYAVAAGHYAAERWQLAAEEFAAFVADHPQDKRTSNALFYRGEALMQLGKFRQARSQFQAAAKQHNDHSVLPRAVFRSGEAAYLSGKLPAAKRDLETFLDRYPDDKLSAYALPYLAEIAMRTGDVPAAGHFYRSALDKFPSGPLADDCLLGSALAMEKLGQRDDALRVLTRLHAKPDSAVADKVTLQLGLVHYRLGNPAQAVEVWEDFETHYPQSRLIDKVAMSRGWALYRLGRFTDAAGQFDVYLDSEPKGAMAALIRVQLAICYARADRLGDAKPTFSKLPADADDDPRVATATLRLAEAVYAAGDAGWAAELFAQLVQKPVREEELDRAIYGWAWALKDQRKEREAESLFSRLNSQYSNSPYWSESTYLLAERAEQSGNIDRAGQLAQSILEARPEQTKVEARIVSRSLYMVGHIASQRGQWDVVYQSMSRIVDEFPETSIRNAAEFWAAEATYRRGEWDEAAERFERLGNRVETGGEPWVAMVPLRRAQILAHQENWTKALQLALSIREDFPDFKQQYEVDYLIGRCLASRGEFAEAREAYGRVHQSAHGGKSEIAAKAQWMIGETYMHQKQYGLARREYLRTEILYAFPEWQARALMQAGKCYELEGRPERAVELYVRLMKNHPKSESAKQAAERLRTAQQQGAKR